MNELGALSQLANCELVLTDIVWEEATRKPSLGAAARSILSGISLVKKHTFLANAPETQHFAKLRAHYPTTHYHDGELSVIALAAADTGLVPVIFERRGHVAACDELRRSVLTGHWFFSELQTHHGLPETVFHACVALLHSKSYLSPTWY